MLEHRWPATISIPKEKETEFQHTTLVLPIRFAFAFAFAFPFFERWVLEVETWVRISPSTRRLVNIGLKPYY